MQQNDIQENAIEQNNSGITTFIQMPLSRIIVIIKGIGFKNIEKTSLHTTIQFNIYAIVNITECFC